MVIFLPYLVGRAMRVELLGVKAHPLTMQELNSKIEEIVFSESQIVIGNHNLHSVYLYHTDAQMQKFFDEAEIAFIDGMFLVFWAKLKGYALNRSHRVTYVDWIRPLMREAAIRGWRVFYLGGRPGVAQRAAEILRGEIPGLQLKIHHGYFEMEGNENERIVQEINDFRPHLLLVGMGMPRQEKWVLRNRAQLRVNVILTAGACFDYVAGAIPTPPRWMGQVGLEWLYRLISEPRRLWRRYLLEPLGLIPYFWRDLWDILRRKL